MAAFLGEAPNFVVCDNLKAAVTNPDRYDPGLNRPMSRWPAITAQPFSQPRQPVDLLEEVAARHAKPPDRPFLIEPCEQLADRRVDLGEGRPPPARCARSAASICSSSIYVEHTVMWS